MMTVSMAAEHVPVLAEELVELLDPQPGETAVDAPFGAGGHARLVAERLGSDGLLIAIDRDPVAREQFEQFAADAPCRTRFVAAPFASALEELVGEDVQADVLYMDLGVPPCSSTSPSAASRSSPTGRSTCGWTRPPASGRRARRRCDERRLVRVFREYGEERYARRSRARSSRARARADRDDRRARRPDRRRDPRTRTFAAGHPAERVFQALRIAVNEELDGLDAALPLAWSALREGGRFAGISFHSLEDRRVKRFLAGLARGCVCPPEFPVCVCGREPEALLLARGGLVPGEDEQASNPRSRSARLRGARKLAAGEAA